MKRIVPLLMLISLTSCQSDLIRATWTTSDIQYTPAATLPDQLQRDTLLKAWRGERIGVQALIGSTIDYPHTLSVETRQADATAWHTETGWVRYVITDEMRTCGTHPDTLPSYLVADRIEWGGETMLKADTTQSLWCAIDVPRDADPGIYHFEYRLLDDAQRLATLELSVEVLDRTLPEPHDYAFHLDLWQQPYAVSRYYGVEPWTPEHIEKLRPYIARLARAGQKVASAILFYEPWGEQSNDKFEPMVRTTRKRDGSWSYDYTAFDLWVELLAEYGIDEQISCYSMVPWDMSFRYWDEATGDYQYLKCRTSDRAYSELWTAFLQAFAKHLEEKGWLEKTMIAMDERGLDDMKRAYSIAQHAVPGLKMTLAGRYHQELVDVLSDYSITYKQDMPHDEIAQRRAEGRSTTLYVCCADSYPSFFSNAAPVESTFIPLSCIARGYDGLLHWSWINWTDDPLHDTRFKLFAPGDTYFFYPDDSPSIHWERLVDGIQLCEKAHLLHDTQPLGLLLDIDPSDTQSLTQAIAQVRDYYNRGN